MVAIAREGATAQEGRLPAMARVLSAIAQRVRCPMASASF